jgi:hypothetical protein
MNSYLKVTNNLLGSDLLKATNNPNIPKIPVRKDGKSDFLPFYEYKQPWRSSYYESTGISQQKLEKTVNDLSQIPAEYSNVQTLVNENLMTNAKKYSELVNEQNMSVFHGGKAGIETPTLYNGYRLPEGVDNSAFGYDNYIKKFDAVPAFVGSNGYPDIISMENTFRPCKEVNKVFIYADTYDEKSIYPGLRCSPRTGYLTMPIDTKEPGLDKTFSFFANSSQRVPAKVHPDIVKIVQEYLPIINKTGFFLFEEAVKYKEKLPENIGSQSGKLFLDSLIIFKLRNRHFILPSMAY